MHSELLISQTDSRPIYRQIMEQIKLRISVGDWQAGSKLPSIRELAVGARVSVITIKRAYLELEREGIIVTRHGKGSFVAADPALGSRLHHQELEEHLQQAVRLARLLGLSSSEFAEQIDALFAAHPKNANKKESLT